MSTMEMKKKIEELKSLQALIEEAEAEAEAIRDEIKVFPVYHTCRPADLTDL